MLSDNDKERIAIMEKEYVVRKILAQANIPEKPGMTLGTLRGLLPITGKAAAFDRFETAYDTWRMSFGQYQAKGKLGDIGVKNILTAQENAFKELKMQLIGE